MTQTGSSPSYGLWFACTAVKLGIFILAGAKYGYLADELYFLDASDHLAPGYVDFPPAIAWLLAGYTAIAGDSLIALRALACLTGIGVTIVAIEIARLLGARGFGQWLTATVVLFAPAFLSVQSILTMNVFDQLLWVLSFYLLIRFLEERKSSQVLWLGVVFGLALLNKLSIPAWLIALSVSVLLYARWALSEKAVWQAVVIMLVIVSPFLYWQMSEGWLFVEFIAAYNAQPPEAMVIDQPLFGLVATMNPPFALIWIPGLVYGLVAKGGNGVQPGEADRPGNPGLPAGASPARVVGTAAVVCLALFLAAGVKFYFATPLFVVFTALGAICWERWLASRRLMRVGLLTTMLVSGVVSIPIAAPVLPPSLLQEVVNFMRDGEQGFEGSEPAPVGRYFPHFAEMHGWPELVRETTKHYQAIPEGERDDVALVAAYFGQAGALNRLDRDDALPAAHSGHVSYHLWSQGLDLEDILFVGFTVEELEGLYDEIEVLGSFQCERCMARENGLYFIRARNFSATVSTTNSTSSTTIGDRAIDSETVRSQIKRFYFF